MAAHQFTPAAYRTRVAGAPEAPLDPMSRRSPISAQSVRRLALALPHTVESSHFAQPDFRVGNKIFATLPREADIVCLKTTRANLDALIAADAETFSDEWRGRWLRVRLDRITAAMLADLLFDAWSLVAPKAFAKAYRASHEPLK
jgi:hypothetical protein